jgi:hypothetical protein
VSKKKIHLLFAIDASGSMYHLAADVRGGFNQYLDDLDPAIDYRVTVYMFHTKVWEHCTDVPPADVPRLSELNYRPGGGTALHDAIGKLVKSVKEKKTSRHLVVINTDGEENSSLEWKRNGVRALIREKKATDRWDFVFLGAGPDTWRQGLTYGMDSAMTVNSRAGTRGMYAGMTVGTRTWSDGGTGQDVAASSALASGQAEKADRLEVSSDDDDA